MMLTKTNRWLPDEAKRDTDWTEAYVLSPKYRAKSYGKVFDDADSESHIDETIKINVDGIYGVLAEVKLLM